MLANCRLILRIRRLHFTIAMNAVQIVARRWLTSISLNPPLVRSAATAGV
jgi:hypothetical protein